MIFVGIVNVIAYCLFDYSVRIYDHWPEINRVSVTLEIICNIIYGVDMIMRMIAEGVILEEKTYLRKF